MFVVHLIIEIINGQDENFDLTSQLPSSLANKIKIELPSFRTNPSEIPFTAPHS